MTDLFAARSQMAISLAFHILFAIAGMAMPVLMAAAEALHLRTKNPVYRELAKRWAKGTAILFAVGAVSGTVLSFELGLLWPEFMRHAGPLIGMPFSLEGFAFFLEAIFLGLFLYGWDRLTPRLHLLCGLAVGVCGLASAVFVTAVNAWMNEPAGFSVVNGEIVNVDPWAAMFNEAFPTQALHVALSAYAAVAVLVLGIHAGALIRRRDSEFHRAAFRIALVMAMVSVPAQLVSGDLSAKHIAKNQPIKLAAAEALFETQAAAPLAIGGIPDEKAGELVGAVELPGALSFLAFADVEAEVKGLDEFPRDEWPPVAVVHVAFDVMVGCGIAMAGLVAIGGLMWWRRREPWNRLWYLRAAVLCAPLGLVAIEAGWVVTEVGRQPWIVRGFMRTAEAVTPMPGLILPMMGFTFLYFFLGVIVVLLMRRHVLATTEDAARGGEG